MSERKRNRRLMSFDQIDINRLRKDFSYDPETGAFERVIARSKRAVLGADCVRTRPDGYQSVSIHTARFDLHRVIWLYHYGTIPLGHIDHINGNPRDNRIANLREATACQNEWNKGRQKNNTSGYKGVSFVKQTGRYTAKINANKRQYRLGTFDTAIEAATAYEAAAKELHGEFARLTILRSGTNGR